MYIYLLEEINIKKRNKDFTLINLISSEEKKASMNIIKYLFSLHNELSFHVGLLLFFMND